MDAKAPAATRARQKRRHQDKNRTDSDGAGYQPLDDDDGRENRDNGVNEADAGETEEADGWHRRRRRQAQKARAAQHSAPRFIDEHVWDLVRTRLSPATSTSNAASATGPLSDPFGTAKTRAEHSCFAYTVFADQPGDGTAPASHVARPATVVWRRGETIGLSLLGRPPSDASLSPPTSATPTGQTLPPCWYVPPQLAAVLERGAQGYGIEHARPPSHPSGSANSASADSHAMTTVQHLVLRDQNSTARCAISRALRVDRTLRTQAADGGYRLVEFLTMYEAETGLRLVHFSAVPMASTATVAAEITLAYSLDPGGRYFLRIGWTQPFRMPSGSASHRPDAAPPSAVMDGGTGHGADDAWITTLGPWWGDAILADTSRLNVTQYTCACI